MYSLRAFGIVEAMTDRVILYCWDCERPLAEEPEHIIEGQNGPVALFYCACMIVNRFAWDAVRDLTPGHYPV